MALRRMWDAAFPPTSPPKWEVAAGYIGGNTPHVWTEQEWARQPARWRLPVFTRSVGGDPTGDAAAAVGWLRAHSVPKGVCVALDFETRVDAGYLNRFDDLVAQAGWRTMVYGTRRTVVQNPEPSGGYWVAEWTGVPHLIPGSAATQWSGSGPFGGAYDPNLIADTTPLWDTQGGFTVLDDTTKQYLDGQFATLTQAVNNGVGLIIRGDVTTDPAKDTHPNNLERARQDIAAARDAIVAQLGVLARAVQQAADPAAVAALVAGQLEIVGITTDPAGTVTVTFGSKAPA